MNPSTSSVPSSKPHSNPNHQQRSLTTSRTSYRDQPSNLPASSSSPPPFSSPPSSPPVSPTFEYARTTSSSSSSFADPLAANAKGSFSKNASFSRRDSRVGRASIASGSGSGISSMSGKLEVQQGGVEDGVYLEPGSPSFGRGVKSLGVIGGSRSTGKKRSLPVSPQQSQTASSLSHRHLHQRSSPGDDEDPSDSDIFSSSRLMPPPSSTSILLDSHKSVLGGQAVWTAPPTDQASRVLGGLFGLSDNTSASDDANSSSDDAMDWGRPDSDQPTSSSQPAIVGLALGAAFEEKIIKPQNPFASKVKSFQRWGSDPHSAFGAAPSSSSNKPAQRRRLTGTSPKKLTRTSNSRLGTSMDSIEMEVQDTSEESTFEDFLKPPSRNESQGLLWRRIVSDAVGIDGIANAPFNNSRSTLDASSKDLTFVHPCIADLKNYVSIAPPPPPDKVDNSSPRSRKENAVADEDPHSARNRQFAASLSRTNTPQNAQLSLNGSPNVNGSSSAPSSPAGLARSTSKAALPSYEHLTLLLAQNHLMSLPSALFSVTKLTVLSLRSNRLKVLPPAIGELQNLREFNIGGNQLTYLPSEILKLSNLTNFTSHPNPWKKPPLGADLSVRPLLGSTAWRLISSSKTSSQQLKEDEQPPSTFPSLDTFRTSTPPSTKTLDAPRQPMGPPALPLRLQVAANETRARTFQRTTSDVQVDELLAQGRGLGSIGSGNSSSEMDSQESSPFPCEGRARFLGEVEFYDPKTSGIPSLQELCIRALLSPPPISLPSPTTNNSRGKTLLDNYENGVLSKCKGRLSVETFKTLEAARRSAGGRWGGIEIGSSSSIALTSSSDRPFSRTASNSTNASRLSRSSLEKPKGKEEKASWCSEAQLMESFSEPTSEIDGMESDDADLSDFGTGSGIIHQSMKSTVTPMAVETSLDNGDDSNSNPWFSRCPNPYHSRSDLNYSSIHQAQSAQNEGLDWPLVVMGDSNGFNESGPIFRQPAEMRYEWISHIAGSKVANLKNLKTSFTGSKFVLKREDVRVEEGKMLMSTNPEAEVIADSSDADETITEGKKIEEKAKGPLVDGSSCIPILWRGCSRNCLAFLQEVEE